jgi:hypothetical protein
MNSARKYGDKVSHVIPVWNGILEHRKRMGNAIWEFLWCLDRITDETEGVGRVLGGQPVTLRRIAKDVPGSDLETVRLHLETLVKEKYIRRRRTPYGYVIEVLNSRKREIWKSEKRQNAVSPGQEKPQNTGRETVKHGERNLKTGVNKEDKAVQVPVTKQQQPACELWQLLRLDPSKLPPPFCAICEGLFATKGDQGLGELVGVCMDRWQDQGKKIPAPFARAAKEVRQRETTANTSAAPIAEIPSLGEPPAWKN